MLNIFKKTDTEGFFLTQILPIGLTFVICAVLTGLLYVEIRILNRFTATDILLQVHWADVAVGLTIYLKTSVDFAIFIGNLMAAYPTWRGRVAIEIGTALGNAAGTIIVLALWAVFKDIKPLLALMIFLAALVLFRLAQDGLEHSNLDSKKINPQFLRLANGFERLLAGLNKQIAPILNKILPTISLKPPAKLAFYGLFVFSLSVPFVLGLDDFAGYVPVFNVVNVFGFSIGVLIGHMILNIFLFISPRKTIAIVKNPYIAFIGSLVFVALGIFGLFEVYRILFLH